MQPFNAPALLSACLIVADATQEVVVNVDSTARHPGTAHSNETLPSRRCVHREEWQGVCRLWSGRPHHRYLKFGNLRGNEGIGATLLKVKWALDRAIAFDLEPVFYGPFTASHNLGDFGDFVGLTNSPYLEIQDLEAFENAAESAVPFPEGKDDAWFLQDENRTSVVYRVGAVRVKKDRNWGVPVSPPNSSPGVCRYAREALRNIYWAAPRSHGRCRAFLPGGLEVPPEVDARRITSYRQLVRPWVLAVHVRRGDMVHFRDGARSVPHKYFSATVKSVLQGIAAVDPAAHVFVLVFSEGSNGMNELQLPDEHGEPITWDIERESCLDIGLHCRQVKRSFVTAVSLTGSSL